MRKLSEIDVLRIRLASAHVRIAEVEKQAVLEKICLQYQIDPEKEAIDMGTWNIVTKGAGCGD